MRQVGKWVPQYLWRKLPTTITCCLFLVVLVNLGVDWTVLVTSSISPDKRFESLSSSGCSGEADLQWHLKPQGKYLLPASPAVPSFHPSMLLAPLSAVCQWGNFWLFGHEMRIHCRTRLAQAIYLLLRFPNVLQPSHHLLVQALVCRIFSTLAHLFQV